MYLVTGKTPRELHDSSDLKFSTRTACLWLVENPKIHLDCWWMIRLITFNTKIWHLPRIQKLYSIILLIAESVYLKPTALLDYCTCPIPSCPLQVHILGCKSRVNLFPRILEYKKIELCSAFCNLLTYQFIIQGLEVTTIF